MIYYIAQLAKTAFPICNVVHYVSFRALAALVTALGVSLCLGPIFIAHSGEFFKSKARPYTPENHQKKNMPTMGGIVMVLAVLVAMLLWSNLVKPQVWIAMLCMMSFAAIGCWDDVSKLSSGKGISAALKFSLQIAAAALVVGVWFYYENPSTALVFPFFKNIHPELGLLFIPWAMFILVGTSNAVNLTDGLDGLAVGTLISNFATFSVIAYVAGHVKLATYLQIPFAGSAEMVIVSASLIGASLGFLWFNTYPAQIIMGDVGSLGLGAVLAFIVLVSKQELLLMIAGGLFVAETLSVIVQVLSMRFLKRRMFKMAPIHHHFELIGWPESKITIRFYIISFVLCLIALMTLKLR